MTCDPDLGPAAPVTKPAALWCPAWPRKIPPAPAPSGDAHGNPGSYRLCRTRPSTRPGPGKTTYVRSPRTRGAAMSPHRPRAPQPTARTATPPTPSSGPESTPAPAGLNP
jgi:hypothetical protein